MSSDRQHQHDVTESVLSLFTRPMFVAEDYCYLTATEMGIPKNPTPRELGVICEVDLTDGQVGTDELRRLCSEGKASLSLAAADGYKIEVHAHIGEVDQLYGHINLSHDMREFMVPLTFSGMRPSISVEGPCREGFVLLYSEDGSLRDWFFGVARVSPAGYMMPPAPAKIAEQFGIRS